MVEDHQVDDSKFRSRKFRLAILSFVVVTVDAHLVAGIASLFLWLKIIDSNIWHQTLSLACYWWLFSDATILGMYGGANVIEKWSPK